MAYLKFLDKNSKSIELPEKSSLSPSWEFSLGRDSSCDISFNTDVISRHHASLTYNGTHFQIADQGSTNGTTLIRNQNQQEKRITLVAHRQYLLQSGDIVELGTKDRLRFQDGPIEIGPGNLNAPDNPQLEVTLSSNQSTAGSSLWDVIEGILEISRTLASKFNDEEMGDLLVGQLMRIFSKGQRFMLFSTVPKSNRLRLLAWKFHPGRRRIISENQHEDEVPRYSRTIYRLVVEERNSVILTDVENEAQEHGSMIDMGIRSIMCAPVESPDGRVMGMLQIDADQKSKFQRSDLEILKVIAQQVGATMQMAELHRQAIEQAKLKAEMKHASEIAKQFLPHGVPNIPGFEFFAAYQSADDVGGDFYDFTQVNENCLAISVCDVVGHGVAAALIMARLSSDLRNAIKQLQDPAQALEQLDAILMPVLNPPDSFDSRYISMAMSFLDLTSGRLTLTNAGHPPLLIKRRDGRLETPDRELNGRLIGADFGDESFKAINFFEKRDVELFPGDVVIYYSDGVTEARNKENEYFGSPDFGYLAKAIKETVGGPKAIGQAIIKAYKAFTLGLPAADDVTVVCFGPTVEFKNSA